MESGKLSQTSPGMIHDHPGDGAAGERAGGLMMTQNTKGFRGYLPSQKRWLNLLQNINKHWKYLPTQCLFFLIGKNTCLLGVW